MNDPTNVRRTLLERIQEQTSIETIVGALYFNILQDTRIAFFFADISLVRLLEHQRQLLVGALGGDVSNWSLAQPHADVSLREAHHRLVEEQGLGSIHFDALLDNLKITLLDLAIDADLVNEAVFIIEGYRVEVLGQKK